MVSKAIEAMMALVLSWKIAVEKNVRRKLDGVLKHIREVQS